MELRIRWAVKLRLAQLKPRLRLDIPARDTIAPPPLRRSQFPDSGWAAAPIPGPSSPWQPGDSPEALQGQGTAGRAERVGVGHVVASNIFRDSPTPAVQCNGNVDCVFEGPAWQRHSASSARFERS